MNRRRAQDLPNHIEPWFWQPLVPTDETRALFRYAKATFAEGYSFGFGMMDYAELVNADFGLDGTTEVLDVPGFDLKGATPVWHRA